MAKQGKPNILVIWGDDIGVHNLSAYNHGVMGYRTPNIDRIAREGALFTDAYAQQSCTAGRASFILGQHPFRTGLLTIGMPGSEHGIPDWSPTIADLLKPLGYMCGQFGKNHLGDRDKHLPTAHGFDEFFGNLYHLNAEEEPELRDYPTDKDIPGFRAKYGPRGVLHTWANPDGTQKIDNTGPLTKKRMETVDDEFLAGAVDFIKRQHAAGKPFFVWFNTTGMHLRTHAKPSSLGQSGRWQSEYHDAMIDHDKRVGELLKLLDDLGIGRADDGAHSREHPAAPVAELRDLRVDQCRGRIRRGGLLHGDLHARTRLPRPAHAPDGAVCTRRQKKYESPQSTPVAAAQPHASGPSPTARCAMSAETSVMAKPAYAHSLSRDGTGASSTATPRNLAHESSTLK